MVDGYTFALQSTALHSTAALDMKSCLRHREGGKMVAESQIALHLAIALASEGWGLNPVPSLWDTKSGHFFPSSSLLQGIGCLATLF